MSIASTVQQQEEDIVSNDSVAQHRAPTLEEVAALAGVSRATVSRAINGGALVSPSAQQAINQAIDTLGYVPNRAARSLVTRRVGSIAIAVPEPGSRVFSDAFFARVVDGIMAKLDPLDIQVVLLMLHPQGNMERMARYLRGGYVDGVVLTSHHDGDGISRSLSAARVPHVLIGRPQSSDLEHPFVDVDNIHGGRLGTEHLINQGCKVIGAITGPLDMTAAVDRHTGFQDALKAANLTPGPVLHGNFTEESGFQAMQEIMAMDNLPDGVFISSDRMAYGAIRALRGSEIRVPQDIRVVGFDNFEIAELTEPPLTTVINPVEEMAETAVQMLLDQLDRQGGLEPIIFPTKLVVRGSA